LNSQPKISRGQKINGFFFIPSLEGGGAEKVMVELLSNINRERIEPILVMLYEYENSPYRSSLPKDIRIIVIKRGSDANLDKLKQYACFIKTVLREKPDVIVSMLTHCNIMALSAKLIFRIKTIICEHITIGEVIKTQEGEKMLWFPTRHLVKLFYRYADKIIGVSEGIKANLVEEFNITPNNIEVIYNPIDLDRVPELGELPVEHIFFADRVPIICGVGRLVRQKGFDILLKAFRTITEKMDARLIILGEGPENEELSRLADNLAITEKVSFVGFQKNPYKFISKADIFVLSSRYEGLPMVILEAMACGRPVVSTDCKSGPRELLDNGKHGVLVPTEDIDALSSAILKLLRDKALRERFSVSGKQQVKDFDAKKIVSKYEEMIYKVMSAAR
jgi:glycosyltransferase involved in cell wall biosynthesis